MNVRSNVFGNQAGQRAADETESEIAHCVAIACLEKMVGIDEIDMQNVHPEMIADKFSDFPNDAAESYQAKQDEKIFPKVSVAEKV